MKRFSVPPFFYSLSARIVIDFNERSLYNCAGCARAPPDVVVAAAVFRRRRAAFRRRRPSAAAQSSRRRAPRRNTPISSAPTACRCHNDTAQDGRPLASVPRARRMSLNMLESGKRSRASCDRARCRPRPSARVRIPEVAEALVTFLETTLDRAAVVASESGPRRRCIA